MVGLLVHCFPSSCRSTVCTIRVDIHSFAHFTGPNLAKSIAAFVCCSFVCRFQQASIHGLLNPWNARVLMIHLLSFYESTTGCSFSRLVVSSHPLAIATGCEQLFKHDYIENGHLFLVERALPNRQIGLRRIFPSIDLSLAVARVVVVEMSGLKKKFTRRCDNKEFYGNVLDWPCAKHPKYRRVLLKERHMYIYIYFK